MDRKSRLKQNWAYLILKLIETRETKTSTSSTPLGNPIRTTEVVVVVGAAEDTVMDVGGGAPVEVAAIKTVGVNFTTSPGVITRGTTTTEAEVVGV